MGKSGPSNFCNYTPHEGASRICNMAHPSQVVVFPDVRVEPLSLILGYLFAYLGLVLELYLLDAICLAGNSQIWASYINLFIKSAAHSNSAMFASGLIQDHFHKGVSISTGSIYSAPYTMANEVSLVVVLGVVWYDNNISP